MASANQHSQSDIPPNMPIQTISRLVTKRFKEADLLSPQEDARELIQAITGFSVTDFILRGHETVSVEKHIQLLNFIDRRIAGEPVDNILGYREFYGRRFNVNTNVLSPRGDTETLIRCSLDAIDTIQAPIILDVGTGSGAILITLLAERESAKGLGVDISDLALEVARDNAKMLGVTDRTLFLQSEWFANVTQRYDLIVSNPPYITNAAMKELNKDVLNYDPDIALRGGESGLEAYEVIIRDAQNYLKPKGALWVEIGYDQGAAVQSLFENNGFSSVTCVKDLSGHDRCVGGIFATLD